MVAICASAREGDHRRGINVRFGSKADMSGAPGHVRFPPNSDIDCVSRHVCFGPEADIALLFTPPLWPAKRGEKDGQTGVK